VVALDDRCHDADNTVKIRTKHVDLVEYVRAAGGFMNDLRQHLVRPL